MNQVKRMPRCEARMVAALMAIVLYALCSMVRADEVYPADGGDPPIVVEELCEEAAPCLLIFDDEGEENVIEGDDDVYTDEADGEYGA